MNTATASLRPTEDVCVLIADISGYTVYLTSTELKHDEDGQWPEMRPIVVELSNAGYDNLVEMLSGAEAPRS